MSKKIKCSTLSAAIELEMGVVIDTIPDGKIHRFQSLDDMNTQESGWYVDNGVAGAFGDWRTSEKFRFNNAHLSKSERRALSQKLKGDRESRITAEHLKHDKAAGSAWNLWCHGKVARGLLWNPDGHDESKLSDGVHMYVLNKGIKPYAARVYGNVLLVPMFYNRKLVSLQKIDEEGNKRFFYGGRVKGCVCPIGTLRDKIYLCEGYATGCSIHEHSGEAVAVSFNAGNLYEAALHIRREYPDVDVIVAADNDVGTELRTGINPGIKNALKAGSAINAQVIYPEFENGYLGSDFNDYFTQGGEYDFH